MHIGLEDVYVSIQTSRERHKATRFLRFIYDVARARTDACQATLEAGILNMLLRLYLLDFRPNAGSNAEHWRSRRRSLRVAWKNVLSAISMRHETLVVLQLHPLYRLLPKKLFLPLTSMIKLQVRERGEAWRSLDRELVEWRLRTIRHATVSSELFDGTTEIFDVYADLLEFSKYVLTIVIGLLFIFCFILPQSHHIYEHSIERQAISLILHSLSVRIDPNIWRGSCMVVFERLTRIVHRALNSR
jgi:hypothetical protein